MHVAYVDGNIPPSLCSEEITHFVCCFVAPGINVLRIHREIRERIYLLFFFLPSLNIHSPND